MAKRKRKTSGRSTASRRKNRTQDRMPAGLITLFAGLVLMALAFVPGSSAWRTMHDVLFGVFGCGSFVLGAALCYLAILYTRGEDFCPTSPSWRWDSSSPAARSSSFLTSPLTRPPRR